MTCLNSPFTPPSHQLLPFSSAKVQGRSPCPLQSQAEEDRQQHLCLQIYATGFLSKHNQRAQSGHLHTVWLELSPRKRKICILAFFSLRRSKFTAPNCLSYWGWCCVPCPNKLISGSQCQDLGWGAETWQHTFPQWCACLHSRPALQ